MSRIIAISATAADSKVRLSLNYVRSLESAGLVPMAVPPLADPARAAEIIGAAGGLLLTGGEDLDPKLYGAPAHPKLGGINPERDATELALFNAARDRRLPVLAICRGIQLVNVACGGTLYQDLPSEKPSSVQHDQPNDRAARTHDVTISAGSRLAAATGAVQMAVNSYHHQAACRLGAELRTTATALDGVIEGMESTDPAWWVVAVQWHPEDLTTDVRSWDRGIFKAFAGEVERTVPARASHKSVSYGAA
jgi:putative glutamine amidotransferase